MSSAAATALLDARKTFPALRDRVFLDAACVSLIAQPVYDEIRQFLDICLSPDAADASQHHIAMDEARPRTVAEAARLINADPSCVALVESTSHGLNIVANALPLRAGDKVLIADTEFLQVAIPWQIRAKRDGIEIVPVPTHDEGVVTPEDFANAMDARTKVVCVSSVQWNTGWRIDVGALGELCRARGIYLIVDAIQELGACPIDVTADPVDALIAGGHKWLNAPFGCGVLYLGARILDELEPTFTCGDPAEDRALVDRLLARRIFVSIRYTSGVGGIRVSTHFFNNESDTDTLIENVRI